MAIGNDLKAFYPLDSNADDSWGAHNGTATAGVSFSGSYATFGGAGDYIEVANSVQLNSATGSVSCWFKTTTPHGPGAGTGAVFVGKTDATLSRNGWNLLMYNGELHAQIKDGVGGSNSLSGGSGLNDGSWHHALLVFSSGGTSTLYLDGSQIATTGSTISFSVSSQPARMGESVDTNWGSYTGDLDEVVLWSQALSAADVAAIYTKGRGNFSDFLTLPAGLQAFYPLDTNSNEYYWGVLNGSDTSVSYGSGYATYNGTSSYTEMGNVLNFGTSDFSIAGWVYAVSVPGGGTTGRPCLKWDWTGANYTGFGVTLWHSGGGYAIPNADIIQFHTSDGGSIYGPAEITIPGLSTWFHFTAVRSGTNMILYINGAVAHATAVGAVADVTTTTKMQLGATEFPGSGGALQDFLDGSLDEMAFWNRALSAVEVAAINTAGRGSLATLIAGPAVLKGVFGSIVHNSPPDAAALEGMWGSLVHSVPTAEGRLEGMWGSLVHSVPTPTAIVPDIAGTVLVPATFDGSASVLPTYYQWSWVSTPAGSSHVVGPVPFPDNGAATPIDMTNNAVLYHCEEVSGTTGTDTSGSTNNATLTTITVGQPGKVGSYAWQFTGSGSKAQPTTIIPIPGDYSTSFWFKGLAPSSSWRTGLRGNASWHQIIVENGSDRLGLYDGFGFRDSGATLSVGGDWRHIATVATGGNTLFYIDGALVGTVTGYQSTDSINCIGNFQGGGQRFADYIDEIAIWNRALSAVEIADIYNLQANAPLGTSSTFTFTPDVVGTYTINLAISPTVNTNADAVITAAGGGGPPSQGASLQGYLLQGSVLEGDV